MTPVSPVLTEEFQPLEVVYAKTQTEYTPLPVIRNSTGVVLSRWKLTDQERAEIAAGADVFLSIWTFMQPLQPLRVEIGECDRSLMEIAEQYGAGVTFQISAVLCGGTGPKLAFEYLPLKQDSFIVSEEPAITFIDPSIGDGIGNIKCRWYDNRLNLVTPCQAYQSLLDQTEAEILIYCHDDLTVNDPNWLNGVLDLFENPKCVAVGLGGALGLGTRDIYRKRYHISQLQRIQYGSNAIDAETHGERVTGARRVAVVEQYFMAVRVDWLRSRGGWPVEHCNHHMLDGFVACEAARSEMEIHQYAAELHHQGGSSSVSDIYKNASWLSGGTLAGDHIAPHLWIADTYRDVLPLWVGQ